MNEVTLWRGDCLEFMQGMDDKSVDICVIDPPYGIGEVAARNNSRSKIIAARNYGVYDWDKKRFNKDIFDEMFRVSRNQVVFGGNYYTDFLRPSSSWIVWDKLNSGDFADCELAWTSHKKAVRKFAYMWNGCFKQKPEERFHPTQKPLDLMLWVIENYTNPGDTVLDFVMGSGTTGVACVQLGRNFIGCEISEEYFEIAEKRIAQAQAQPRLFQDEPQKPKPEQQSFL